jgi:TrpR-related protein YerC/YecD
MKPHAHSNALTALDPLFTAISALNTPEEAQQFFEDLCTPAELEALRDRWRVVPYLKDNDSYRDIHAKTGVSVTTIGRVARCLLLGTGGYELIFKRLQKGN